MFILLYKGNSSGSGAFLLPILLLIGFLNSYSAGFRAIEGSLGALGCIIVAVKGIGSIDGNGSAMKIAAFGGDMARSPIGLGTQTGDGMSRPT